MMKSNSNHQRRALTLLQNAAQELKSTLDFNDILKRTVVLANDFMEREEQVTRYFSHIAVKEGDRLYFDPNHNLPEIQAMLMRSLGPEAEIILNRAANNRLGITGSAAIGKEPLNVGNVREHPEYIDLKGAGGSQLSVPIIIDDEVVAVLNIEHEANDAFDDEDKQTILALISIVASALDNRENNAALTALFNGVRALTRGFAVDQKLQFVLSEIAKQAFALMQIKARKPGAFAHVGIIQGSDLIYVAAYPSDVLNRFGQETYEKINLDQFNTYDENGNRRRIGISGYAVRMNSTQNVADVGQHDEYLQVNLDPRVPTRTINSQLAVPINLPNREVVGVISIDHPSFAAFSKEDVDNIELLADIAAEAYRVNRQNERQVRALSVLQQAAKRITDNLTLDDILLETANYAKKIVEREFTSEADYVSHLAVREGKYLVFRPEHNDQAVYSTFRIAQSERVKFIDPEPGTRIGIVGRTAQQGISQLVPDVSHDKDYFMIRPTGTQLSVPIFVAGQIYGVVSVEHNEPHFFSAEDKGTIETLAAQVGAVITILNSRFEQARLAERDKQRSLFISNVAHELRTPISQIANFIEGLSRQAYESFDDPDYLTNLPIADRIVKEQRELVDRLLEEARAEGGALKALFSRYDLNQIIRDVVDTYLPRAGEKGLKFNVNMTFDEPLILSLDRFMIKRAIKNLVDNAIKYTDEGQVSIHVRVQDEQVLIDVEDTGIGIPEDEQAKIFDRMIRGEDAAVHERDGIGIGLDLARRYVDLHDGKIMLTRSDKDQGSVFTISLPAKLMTQNLKSS